MREHSDFPYENESPPSSDGSGLIGWMLLIAILAVSLVLLTGCEDQCDCGELLIYTVTENENSVLVYPTPRVPHVAVPRQ